MVIYHCKKQQKHLQETNPIQGLVDNFIGNPEKRFRKNITHFIGSHWYIYETVFYNKNQLHM